MSTTLRIVMLLFSIISLIIVIGVTRNNKMYQRYSAVWIIFSLLMVIISIFPNIVYSISKFIGFEKPSNALFLIAIIVLYCILFYLFVKISNQNKQIHILNYELSKLKKEKKN